MTPEGKADRYDRWQKVGLDAIKADLALGGHRYIGGMTDVRLARQWVRQMEAEAALQSAKEVGAFKPTFQRVNNLKAFWRNAKAKWKRPSE